MQVFVQVYCIYVVRDTASSLNGLRGNRSSGVLTKAREIVCISKGSQRGTPENKLGHGATIKAGVAKGDARAREGGVSLFSGVSGDRPVWQFVKRFIKCVDLYLRRKALCSVSVVDHSVDHRWEVVWS